MLLRSFKVTGAEFVSGENHSIHNNLYDGSLQFHVQNKAEELRSNNIFVVTLIGQRAGENHFLSFKAILLLLFFHAFQIITRNIVCL